MSYRHMIGPDPVREPIPAPILTELEADYLRHLVRGFDPSGNIGNFLHAKPPFNTLSHSEAVSRYNQILNRLDDDGLIIRDGYGGQLTKKGRQFVATLR